MADPTTHKTRRFERFGLAFLLSACGLGVVLFLGAPFYLERVTDPLAPMSIYNYELRTPIFLGFLAAGLVLGTGFAALFMPRNHGAKYDREHWP